MAKAQEALKLLQFMGLPITDRVAIGLVLARADPGASLSGWYNALDEKDTARVSFDDFHAAFIRRFGSRMRVEEVIDALSSILMGEDSLEDYYDRFLLLVARLRNMTNPAQPQRTELDLQRDLIRGLPGPLKAELNKWMVPSDEGAAVWSLERIFTTAKHLQGPRPPVPDLTRDLGLATPGATPSFSLVQPTPMPQSFTRPPQAILPWAPMPTLAVGPPGQTPGVCHECHRPGHLRANCPLVVCRRCGGLGHLSFSCPLTNIPSGLGRGGGNQQGHAWGAAPPPRPGHRGF